MADSGSLTAEEKKQLEAMKHLRDDLRLLNNVPEPQISIDRVRDAILRDGLKPHAEPKVGWSWFVTPAATCAIAFAIMYLRPHGAKADPKILLNPSSGAGFTAINSKFDRSDVDANRIGTFISDPVGAAVNSVPNESDDQTPELSAGHEVARPVVSEAKHSSELIIWPPKEGSASTLAQTVSKPDTLAMSQPTSDAGNIVLIDQERDASNATPRATEVGSPSNVLVGG